MKTAAIIGASGYTGVEMIRLLHGHPRITVAALTGSRFAGQTAAQTHPGFRGLDLPDLVSIADVDFDDIDVAFCCLPHGTSQQVVADLLGKVATVIDLSADYRHKDADTYAKFYGLEHAYPDLLETAVYGLTEWARDDLPGASLVACPGCYPTCTLLPLIPLAAQGLIAMDDIRISAVTGVSGAGRKAVDAFSFSEVADSAKVYGLDDPGHRHIPEIDGVLESVSGEDVSVSFVPHLVPMNRGMEVTTFVRTQASTQTLRDALNDAYADTPFVSVLPDGVVPRTRDVRGSNQCRINIFPDRQPGRAILTSVIDNLTKGSSGQAIQNYNLVQGWEETLGLELAPVFP